MASATSASRSQSATSGSASVPTASQPAADITAITTHDDLLLELGQMLAGQAAVRPVDSLDAAIAAMAGAKRGQVLVIDGREVAEVRAAVDAAHAAAPAAVVLVFAEVATEKQLGTALRGSKVFAVLPMPLDPRKTQAVIEGAIAEAIAKRAPPAPGANPLAALRSELSVDTFQPQPSPVRAHTQPSSRSKMLLAIAGATALALAGTVLWYFTRGEPAHAPASVAAPPASLPSTAPTAVEQGSAPAPAAAPAPSAETSIVHGKVDELLEKARLAMHERRFTEPPGENALLYYRSALAADAESGER